MQEFWSHAREFLGQLYFCRNRTCHKNKYPHACAFLNGESSKYHKFTRHVTPPKTYNSPLKIGLPKRNVIFQPSIFRHELLVSGRVARRVILDSSPSQRIHPTKPQNSKTTFNVPWHSQNWPENCQRLQYRLNKTCQFPGWSSEVMKTNWWKLMKPAFKIHHQFDHVWPQNTTFNSKTQQNKQTNDVAWCSANSKTNSKRLDDTFQRRKFTRPWFSISDDSHCVNMCIFIFIHLRMHIYMYTYFQSYHIISYHIISYPFQTVKFFLLPKFHSKSLQPHPRCTKPIPQDFPNVFLSGSLPVPQ